MTNETTLPAIEIEPHNKPQKSVIWLHGLGADGSDFVPIVPELQLPENNTIRFIFPHAPVKPVTINNGYAMRAWYDVYSLTSSEHVDMSGISSSILAIKQLIEKEITKGIASNHILLAGFSQGAAIALMTGLQYQQPLAGILALSGYLPTGKNVLENIHHANKDIPIFIAHGSEDVVVPYAAGKAAYMLLHETNDHVTWRSYPMAHSVCAQEIRDISLWIQDVLCKNIRCAN